MKGLSEILGTGEDANLGIRVWIRVQRGQMSANLSSFPKIKEGASENCKGNES
jgi:hypothetical protein